MCSRPAMERNKAREWKKGNVAFLCDKIRLRMGGEDAFTCNLTRARVKEGGGAESDPVLRRSGSFVGAALVKGCCRCLHLYVFRGWGIPGTSLLTQLYPYSNAGRRCRNDNSGVRECKVLACEDTCVSNLGQDKERKAYKASEFGIFIHNKKRQILTID